MRGDDDAYLARPDKRLIPSSKHPQRDALRKRFPQLAALREFGVRHRLGGKDRLGALRVEIDDQRLRHALQPPSRHDPVDLALRPFPVRAGGDGGGVGPALDPPEEGVIAAIEHLLHRTGHRGEVFRAGEEIPAGPEQVFRLRMFRPEQSRAGARAFRRRARYRLGGAGAAVPQDQEGGLRGHGRELRPSLSIVNPAALPRRARMG